MELNEFVLYYSQDGSIKVDVLFSDETVWLTIDQLCTLFGKSRSTINEHILHVFSEKELAEETSVRKIGISDFSTETHQLLQSSCRYKYPPKTHSNSAIPPLQNLITKQTPPGKAYA